MMDSLQSNASFYVTTAVATVTGLAFVAVTGGVLLARRVSQSVGLAEPTHAMLRQEKPEENCALFRHFPQLVKKLAWRSLGACRKTPVHICTLPSSPEGTERKLQFLVKREDLISTKYGGNKVRTLQHQLAVCESRRDRGETAFRQLVSTGSGGSNQVLATVVHARALGWDKTANTSSVNVCWDEDKPDLDNTLNMLSVLSFPNVGFTHNWGEPFKVGRTISALWGAWTQTKFVPMILGGNCPAGVLGQVGGILELAEQIVAGESPDPERIYLPVGSACTISGLILGTVLVRHMGIEALSHPDFQIVGCNVHHVLAKCDRLFGLHVNPLFGFMPLTITHSVRNACRALCEIGGPNLEKKCMDFIKTSVKLRSDDKVVGEYGGHSQCTRETAQHYDASGIVTDYKTDKEEKHLWVCGHFVAKALHPLLKDLEVTTSVEQSPKYMLWMTKSAIQPRGEVDEWKRITEENEVIKTWANQGKAESTRRPGRVSFPDGSPEGYRSLMTDISAPKNKPQ